MSVTETQVIWIRIYTCVPKLSKLCQPLSNYFNTKPKLKTNSKKYKELTLGLLNFVVKDLRPFFLVEGEGFRDFVELAIPEFEVSCSTTTTRLCDRIALKERKTLIRNFVTVSDVCLTIDLWTSRVNTSYWGVTCRFVVEWKLHSRVLETLKVVESRTTEIIIENIKLVQSTCDIKTKTSAIECDNEPNTLLKPFKI